MVKILNTIICYNNAKEVVEYVNSLTGLTHSENLAVVIVINMLDRKGELFLTENLKKAKVRNMIVKPGKNLGYMNGMLFGFKKYMEENSDPITYVIMSNTDVSYPEPEFLESFVNDIYSKDTWVIGPAVYVPSRNTFDNPVCCYIPHWLLLHWHLVEDRLIRYYLLL